MAEAVYARCVSALKDERVIAAKKLRGPRPKISTDRKKFIEDIRLALHASKIVSYAQGYMLMRAAAKEYQWDLDYGGIALMWRGGRLTSHPFPGEIQAALAQKPQNTKFILVTYFTTRHQRPRHRGAPPRAPL